MCFTPGLRADAPLADHGEGIQVLRYQEGQKYEESTTLTSRQLRTHYSSHAARVLRRRTLTTSMTSSTCRMVANGWPPCCCTCALPLCLHMHA